MNAKIVVKKTIFKAFVKTNLKRIIIKGYFPLLVIVSI